MLLCFVCVWKNYRARKTTLGAQVRALGCPPCVYFEGSGNTGNSASVFLNGDVFPFLQFVSVHALSNSGQWNCWKHLALSWRLLLQCCQNKCMVVILASQRTLCQIQKILVLSGPPPPALFPFTSVCMLWLPLQLRRGEGLVRLGASSFQMQTNNVGCRRRPGWDTSDGGCAERR